jgi:hypothetical protein
MKAGRTGSAGLKHLLLNASREPLPIPTRAILHSTLLHLFLRKSGVDFPFYNLFKAYVRRYIYRRHLPLRESAYQARLHLQQNGAKGVEAF